jgi:hypothetical protein
VGTKHSNWQNMTEVLEEYQLTSYLTNLALKSKLKAQFLKVITPHTFKI